MIDRNFVVKKILEMTIKKELVWEPITEDFIIADFDNIRLCLKVNGNGIPVYLCLSMGEGKVYRFHHELIGEILDHSLIGIDNEIGQPEVLGVFYGKILEKENPDPTVTRIDEKILDEYY